MPSKLRMALVKPKLPMRRCWTRLFWSQRTVESLGWSSTPSKNSNRPTADVLVGSAGVAEESLLEEGSNGLGVIAVGGVVGAAEPELALRGDGGDGVVGHAAHPGLRELSLPVPVMDALRDADAEKRLQVGIAVVGGRRSEPLPVVVAGALIDGEGDGVRGRCSWGGAAQRRRVRRRRSERQRRKRAKKGRKVLR